MITTCPICTSTFIRRPTQKFCSKGCQRIDAARKSADKRRGKGKSRPRVGPDRKYVYRITAEEAYGPIPPGVVVHHARDPHNHIDPSNLILMTREEHFREHEVDILAGQRRWRERLVTVRALVLSA